MSIFFLEASSPSEHDVNGATLCKGMLVFFAPAAMFHIVVTEMIMADCDIAIDIDRLVFSDLEHLLTHGTQNP